MHLTLHIKSQLEQENYVCYIINGTLSQHNCCIDLINKRIITLRLWRTYVILNVCFWTSIYNLDRIRQVISASQYNYQSYCKVRHYRWSSLVISTFSFSLGTVCSLHGNKELIHFHFELLNLGTYPTFLHWFIWEIVNSSTILS